MRTFFFKPSARSLLAVASLLVIFLSGCSLSLLNNPVPIPPTSTAYIPAGPTATPQPSAAVTFKVKLPSPLQAGEVLNLSVVDEVTGLGLNPVNYAMQGMDALQYTVTIPFALNSVVKYRYVRQGSLPILEDTSADKPVRYRLYHVTGPGAVEDVVSAWAGSLFSSPAGRITGQILDSNSGKPLVNILIAGGGQQTLSDSNGNFILEALPAGTHNLAAYAMDGSYKTFQQGATVEADKTTKVTFKLTPADMVNITFTVAVPAGTIQNVPIRLAGNLTQLGDTFGDLQGGLSTVAARMPVLAPQPDGRYSLTLALPAGMDIHYKYTLGDGFWNAEHSSNGSFVVRQMIVPTAPIQVQEAVETWQSGSFSSVLFEVNAPANTPVGDVVSIQFNPYGWTEPMPMWPRGNNQWVYQLYSPLDMLGDFEYRYCRNDQCGVADDMETAPGKPGRPVSTSLVPQDLQDSISAWAWLQPASTSPVVAVPVNAFPGEFRAGVEFLPSRDPTWQAWIPLAVQDVKGRFANFVVLSPTWSVSQTNPFVFSSVPGPDPLWSDNQDTSNHVRASGMSVALFPQVNLPGDPAKWWGTTPRDAAWWESWFQRYTAFADTHADLAEKVGAQALILGGDWVAPALPGGEVNGASSGVPVDAEARWHTILADVRQRYHGQVLWAVSYPGGLKSAPAFANNLDGIYLLWSAPLNGSSVNDLKAAAGQLLDNDIRPFQTSLNRPVFLAAAYPSAEGAAGEPLSVQALFQPGAAQAQVNLQAQADVYQALLMAVNERAWLGGFISRGYYPAAALQDASASVHGKPAEDVLWYWYGRMMGEVH